MGITRKQRNGYQNSTRVLLDVEAKKTRVVGGREEEGKEWCGRAGARRADIYWAKGRGNTTATTPGDNDNSVLRTGTVQDGPRRAGQLEPPPDGAAASSQRPVASGQWQRLDLPNLVVEAGRVSERCLSLSRGGGVQGRARACVRSRARRRLQVARAAAARLLQVRAQVVACESRKTHGTRLH